MSAAQPTRRAVFGGAIVLGLAVAAPAASSTHNAAAWTAFADEHRWVFPDLEIACSGALAAGFTPEDVTSIVREFVAPRRAAVTTNDGSWFWSDGQTERGAH